MALPSCIEAEELGVGGKGLGSKIVAGQGLEIIGFDVQSLVCNTCGVKNGDAKLVKKLKCGHRMCNDCAWKTLKAKKYFCPSDGHNFFRGFLDKNAIGKPPKASSSGDLPNINKGAGIKKGFRIAAKSEMIIGDFKGKEKIIGSVGNNRLNKIGMRTLGFEVTGQNSNLTPTNGRVTITENVKSQRQRNQRQQSSTINNRNFTPAETEDLHSLISVNNFGRPPFHSKSTLEPTLTMPPRPPKTVRDPDPKPYPRPLSINKGSQEPDLSLLTKTSPSAPLNSFTNPELEMPMREPRSKTIKKTQCKGSIALPNQKKINVHKQANENRDTFEGLMVGPSDGLGGLIKNKTLGSGGGVGGIELGYKKTLTLTTSKLKSMGIGNGRMIKAQGMIDGF